MRNKRKKFYVASPKMIDDRLDWRRAKLSEAIDHATQLMERDASMQEALIVQVVRVVKRKKLPVAVEVVR